MTRAAIPALLPIPDRGKETVFLFRQTREIPPRDSISFDGQEIARGNFLARLFQARRRSFPVWGPDSGRRTARSPAGPAWVLRRISRRSSVPKTRDARSVRSQQSFSADSPNGPAPSPRQTLGLSSERSALRWPPYSRSNRAAFRSRAV